MGYSVGGDMALTKIEKQKFLIRLYQAIDRKVLTVDEKSLVLENFKDGTCYMQVKLVPVKTKAEKKNVKKSKSR